MPISTTTAVQKLLAAIETVSTPVTISEDFIPESVFLYLDEDLLGIYSYDGDTKVGTLLPQDAFEHQIVSTFTRNYSGPTYVDTDFVFDIQVGTQQEVQVAGSFGATAVFVTRYLPVWATPVITIFRDPTTVITATADTTRKTDYLGNSYDVVTMVGVNVNAISYINYSDTETIIESPQGVFTHYAARTLSLAVDITIHTLDVITATYVARDTFVDGFLGHNLSFKSKFWGLEVLPRNFSPRIVDLFAAFEKLWLGVSVDNLDKVRHFYDPEYPRSEADMQILFEMFNYKLFDLGYFTEVARKNQIEQNQFRNIVAIYKNLNSRGIFGLVFYSYDVTATTYLLNTTNWTGFQRTGSAYADIRKLTDTGLLLDDGHFTDSGSRSSFLENEILADKKYTVIITDEVTATADGIATSYSVTLDLANIVPGTTAFRYTVGTQEYTTDVDTGGPTTGAIPAGGKLSSGTINYITGVVVLNFTAAPRGGSTIIANYHNTSLWFYDIDNSIRTQIDNIRHVLSKIFYTLVVHAQGDGDGNNMPSTRTNVTTGVSTTVRAAWYSSTTAYHNSRIDYLIGSSLGANYDDLSVDANTAVFRDTAAAIDSLVDVYYARFGFANGSYEDIVANYKVVNELRNTGTTGAAVAAGVLTYDFVLPGLVDPETASPSEIIKRNSVKFLYTLISGDQTSVYDAGDGTLISDTGGGGYLVSGTINYTTGAVHVVFNTVPLLGTDLIVAFWNQLRVVTVEVTNLSTAGDRKYWGADKYIVSVELLGTDRTTSYLKSATPTIYVKAETKFAFKIITAQ